MREFTVAAAATATGSTTLVFLNPPTSGNVNIEILRNWIGFSGTATSAQQRVQLTSQVSAFPTLTATTPQKTKRADANASILIGSTTGATATAGTNSSADGAGAQTSILEDSFNVLNGWLWVATPPETFIFPSGSPNGYGMKFPTTPSPLGTFAFGTTFREV